VVAILISSEVASWRVFPVRFGRNNGLYATAQKSVPNVVAIITFIGEQQPGLFDRNGHQVFNCIVIRSFSACENEAMRAPLTSVRAWIFVGKPPRDRPKASLSVPLLRQLPENDSG